MCFSASASFIAGITLTAAGVISLKQVQQPSHRFFGAIPLLFGIQQLCEGFVWLSLSDPGFASWHDPAKYSFLFFAQIIWPSWIPIAFRGIEPSPKRKKIMRYFLAGGILISLLLALRLFFFPSEARIDGCHITYEIGSTLALKIVTAVFYLAAIVITPFFTSWRWGLILASVNVLSLAATTFFFEVYFVSVWCFFAAVQSIIVVLVIREVNRSYKSGVNVLSS